MIIRPQDRLRIEQYFTQVIKTGLDFKAQELVRPAHLSLESEQQILAPLPDSGVTLDGVLEEFRQKLLPYCINVAAPGYMSFPMVGNSVAGTAGEFLTALLLQNLLKDELAPSATLAEIAVIQWFREALGLTPCYMPHNVAEVGGTITAGGTASNMIALLLARERKFPGATEHGDWDPKSCGVVVPAGVWNHTISDGKKWLGCGANVIEVATDQSFRMDLADLRRQLAAQRGRVMAVIGYAGNSKTMTVDRLADIAAVTRDFDDRIWLHSDACFGFSLAFSDQLRDRLAGVAEYDSITADPHKVLNVPYPLSVFLTHDPADMSVLLGPTARSFAQEELSLGLITPFFGSRPWMGLKAWFAMKNYGRRGLAELIEDRCRTAAEFAGMIRDDDELVLVNDVDLNAVLFYYSGGLAKAHIPTLNALAIKIHEELLKDGRYEFHLTRLRDPGIFKAGELLRPLRYMSGNPEMTSLPLDEVVAAVKQTGRRCLHELVGT
jgi:L-2,4-diaminobutyrate decarboxylase